MGVLGHSAILSFCGRRSEGEWKNLSCGVVNCIYNVGKVTTPPPLPKATQGQPSEPNCFFFFLVNGLSLGLIPEVMSLSRLSVLDSSPLE